MMKIPKGFWGGSFFIFLLAITLILVIVISYRIGQNSVKGRPITIDSICPHTPVQRDMQYAQELCNGRVERFSYSTTNSKNPDVECFSERGL